MPRRSQRNVILVEPEMDCVCSRFLTSSYFELLKDANKTPSECPICLEEINCPHCFMLLKCGHHVHVGCFYRQVDKVCPLCREWEINWWQMWRTDGIIAPPWNQTVVGIWAVSLHHTPDGIDQCISMWCIRDQSIQRWGSRFRCRPAREFARAVVA